MLVRLKVVTNDCYQFELFRSIYFQRKYLLFFEFLLELNCVGILWQQNTIMFKCLAKTIGEWTKANLLGYIFKKMFLLVGIVCSVDAFRHTISVCLSINLSIYLDRLVSQCIGWSVHPSVLLSIGLLVHWLVDRSVGWSVSPSVCLSVNSKQNECPSGSKMPSQMAQFLYCVQLYEQMFESN